MAGRAVLYSRGQIHAGYGNRSHGSTAPTPAIFTATPPPANYFRFRVTPNLEIAIAAMVKRLGDQFLGQMTELMAHDPVDPQEMEAYEELLGDAMHGNQMHFARQDYVEEAWRIVDPILDNATPVHPYQPGTWGPAEANSLVGTAGWVNPVATPNT